jgi:hypothetical protein
MNWLGEFPSDTAAAAAKGSPLAKGDAYYNNADGQAYVYDGAAWKVFAKQGAFITGSVTISGTPALGQTLTVAYDNPGNAPQVYYRWYRDSDDTTYVSTTSAYPLVAYDIGHTLTVRVYAVGSTGYKESTPTAAVTGTPTPLTVGADAASAVWQTGAIAADESDWYSFTAASGTTYKVQWDDSIQGTATYSANVNGSAYRADGTAFFTDLYNSYTTPQTITGYSGTVYLKVTPYFSGPLGTYAVRVYAE